MNAQVALIIRTYIMVYVLIVLRNVKSVNTITFWILWSAIYAMSNFNL